MKDSIISGAYDLHVHTAPDLFPRKIDDIDMAQRIIETGMAGFVIKSHYFCTADRAALINKMFPACHAIGGICLNKTSGGINPYMVEMAGRAGAKVVWFPTTDNEVGQKYVLSLPKEKQPIWTNMIKVLQEAGIDSTPIMIMKEGKFIPEVYDILDLIAKHKMILATGHLSINESISLIKVAKERKVERIIITHVSWPLTFYDISIQKELLKYGVYMEHCVHTCISGKVDYDIMVNQMKTIGADSIVVSTDLGHLEFKYPDEELIDFCERLIRSGISEHDIRKMIVDNPISLLG